MTRHQMDHIDFDPNKPEMIVSPCFASWSEWRIDNRFKFHQNFGRLVTALKNAGNNRKYIRCYTRHDDRDEWYEIDTQAIYDGSMIVPVKKDTEDVSPCHTLG